MQMAHHVEEVQCIKPQDGHEPKEEVITKEVIYVGILKFFTSLPPYLSQRLLRPIVFYVENCFEARRPSFISNLRSLYFHLSYVTPTYASQLRETSSFLIELINSNSCYTQFHYDTFITLLLLILNFASILSLKYGFPLC